MYANVFHVSLDLASKRAHAKGACPALDPPRPSFAASFIPPRFREDMAQTGLFKQSTHAFNPDATLSALADSDNGVISNFIYEAQSSSDAFKYASSPEKRDRLLNELLQRKDSILVTALGCMLF